MVQSQNLKSIILTGPTAVGKSSLAIQVAQEIKAALNIQLEIINADSVCFYQEFNIGSAKPTEKEMALIPHHLIDCVSPLENYHAGQFLKDCEIKLAEIHARGNRALIVGGSGFYLKSLRFGLWDAPETSPEFRKTLEAESTEALFKKLLAQDEVHANKVGASDRYRLIRGLEILAISGKKPSELEAAMPKDADARFALWTIDRERPELEMRMRNRIIQMLEEGLVEETEKLRQKYSECKTLHAVGYQQVLNQIDGILPEGRIVKQGREGLVDEISLVHRQLAKQQRTWSKNLAPDENFLLNQDLKTLKEKLITFYK